MKSLTLLWTDMLHESGAWCCTSTNQDEKYVLGRIEGEGLSFLTITLPSFGKSFEQALDRGRVDSDLFAGFQRRGGLPAFLSGFLRRIFDASSGELLHDPCIASIQVVRQLTLMFGKIEIPCSERRTRKAMDGYVQTDLEVGERSRSLRPGMVKDLRRFFTMLNGQLFSSLDRKLWSTEYDSFMPKHGPGATGDHLVGNNKWSHCSWSDRLEKVLPFGEFCIPNWRYFDVLESVDFQLPGSELPVRVIPVPKTQLTPRIIAIEPTYKQYAQQSILHAILDEWRKDDLLHSFVGFDDQVPNQELAREGSLSGELATLDLSEASDRVSYQLVLDLLEPWPHIREAIDACRSATADVPGHGVVSLSKYASMGSALTFPIEAMVFIAIIFSSIAKDRNSPPSQRLMRDYLGRVRVFGDDIIVPVEHVRSVTLGLESFGFKVNQGKSFWTGKFRESCGKEYYDGDDVSIVKVRQLFPRSRKDAVEVIALSSFRNQLYLAGYWRTCQRLDQRLRRLLRHFPVISDTSPVLGRHSVAFQPEGERECQYLHRPLTRGWVVDARIPKNPLDGYAALVKFFVVRRELPLDDPRHLERSGRPAVVDIKLRWSPVA